MNNTDWFVQKKLLKKQTVNKQLKFWSVPITKLAWLQKAITFRFVQKLFVGEKNPSQLITFKRAPPHDNFCTMSVELKITMKSKIMIFMEY